MFSKYLISKLSIDEIQYPPATGMVDVIQDPYLCKMLDAGMKIIFVLSPLFKKLYPGFDPLEHRTLKKK